VSKIVSAIGYIYTPELIYELSLAALILCRFFCSRRGNLWWRALFQPQRGPGPTCIDCVFKAFFSGVCPFLIQYFEDSGLAFGHRDRMLCTSLLSAWSRCLDVVHLRLIVVAFLAEAEDLAVKIRALENSFHVS
jgi:hypothetical protein